MNKAYEFLQAVIDSPKISKESRQRLEAVEFHSAYAEPGYSDPESGIICTGNWNNAQKKAEPPEYWVDADDYVERAARVLEKRYGVELEWSDEWMTCSDCSKLIRSQADCYQWQPAYVLTEGECICRECAKKHAEEILATFEGDNRKALTRGLGIDPADYGYVQILDKLENGLHEGMASNPKVISKELKKLGVERFLFVIDEASQFYITFSCWVHRDGINESWIPLAQNIKTDEKAARAKLAEQVSGEAP